MKRLILVGALIGAVGVGIHAQGAQQKQEKKSAADQGAGHATPNPQPPTETAPAVPEGELKLGSVNLTKPVKANGQSLPAGTYQVTLTPQSAQQPAPGQTPGKERWLEFSKGGKVVGKEIVIIVPQSEIAKVQKDTPPANNASKVEMLKGGDYVRLWIHRNGNHFLVYFPSA